MMRKMVSCWLLCVLLLVGLSGCSGSGNSKSGVLEGGYTMPFIPIRISLNANGEVNLGISGSYATPIGTFDVGYGGSVYSLREQYSNKVLIVRVDGKATVYELESGKEFHVEFEDDNHLYRRVALNYEDDGDIVLELESVDAQQGNADAASTSAPSASQPDRNAVSQTVKSCPGAPPQRIKDGDQVYVCTASETVKLRKKPGKQYDVLKYLVPGADLLVTGGPKCSDNWSWWKVRTESGMVGWISEGGDNVDAYFICPR